MTEPETCDNCDTEIENGDEAYSIRTTKLLLTDDRAIHAKRKGKDKPVGLLCEPCGEEIAGLVREEPA